MSATPVYCINHPKTETLLRCNKCGNPVCIKCVDRTPVGYRCKTCLNIQHAGYYTATPIDYVIVLVVGTLASMIGGAIALALGGWWFISFFYAPAAGGAIAEMIHWALRKRRGKYIGLLASATVVIGALLVAGAIPLFMLVFAALGNPKLLPFATSGILGALFNIGLWIYLVLAVGTVYARLRS
mgnify:CR=1 FL=1